MEEQKHSTLATGAACHFPCFSVLRLQRRDHTYQTVAILFVNAAAAFFFKDRIVMLYIPSRLRSSRLNLTAQKL